MFDKKTSSTDIRRAIFAATLAQYLPKDIHMSEISMCAAKLLEHIDYMRDNPTRLKEFVN